MEACFCHRQKKIKKGIENFSLTIVSLYLMIQTVLHIIASLYLAILNFVFCNSEKSILYKHKSQNCELRSRNCFFTFFVAERSFHKSEDKQVFSVTYLYVGTVSYLCTGTALKPQMVVRLPLWLTLLIKEDPLRTFQSCPSDCLSQTPHSPHCIPVYSSTKKEVYILISQKQTVLARNLYSLWECT